MPCRAFNAATSAACSTRKRSKRSSSSGRFTLDNWKSPRVYGSEGSNTSAPGRARMLSR
ncbi:hypothetical protein FQZ97_1219440 [compost metagenome]